ncbi:uncharacterized protein LOC142553942 [Primulina tabacum]|uniref:uncharacterized protein LOC142553942 n=1 Tax=Primulina tabacum TaxID=48773 RepID=UPI003F59B19D
MPTYTTATLQSYFESRAEESLKNPLSGASNGRKDPNPSRGSRDGAPRHVYVSPNLYVTPVQAPIPQCYPPDPLSPSPYVVNHKRRGNEWKRCCEAEVVGLDSGNEGGYLCSEEEVGENFAGDEKLETFDIDEDEEVSEYQGEEETNYNGKEQIESCSFASAQGEFFDANDDFSADGSTPKSYGSRTESELNAIRLVLLEEIERRKNVEENMTLIRGQWERISSLMHQAGLTFPGPPSDSCSTQFDNMIDLFSQEVLVSRFVAEAVGRGQASAEAEEADVSIIESKDQEILRLHDRLQYLETVNHEMSQRNFVEVARRRQERKRSRRRWLWTFMGFSIAVGTSFVAYSYIPQSSKYLPLLKSGNSTDAASYKTS